MPSIFVNDIFINDIFQAIEKGTIAEVRYFVENEGDDVNAKGEHGSTPLHKAAETSTLDVIQYLVAQGANVNAQYWRHTPLHEAAKKNSLEVLQYLISQGADVHAKGYEGSTLLHYAAEGNSVEVLQYLVSQGADVLAKGSLGWTPIHKVAESNTLEVLQYLISQGADVDEETGGGDTPLHLAINKNLNMPVVEYLVFKSSDVNVKNGWGSTPLHLVDRKNNRGDECGIPIMQNLILRGADVNAKNIFGRTPMDETSSEEKKRILREAVAITKKAESQSLDCEHTQNTRNERMEFTGKFTDYILLDAIKPEVKATNKLEIVREMVQSLVDAGGIKQKDYEGIVKLIFKREELASTALGRGIAFPEAEHPCMERPVVAIAISAEGIDFDSLDEEKTHLFFMVISPLGCHGVHGRVMIHITEYLTRQLKKDDTFRCSLMQAKTWEEIIALLEEDDSKEKR